MLLRAFAWLMLLMLLCTLFPCSPARAEAQVVRVGWYDSTDFQTGPNGERSGYAYDYMQEIAQYTGWTYEYVHGTWAELYEMLVAGDIDMLSYVTYREARLPLILYSAKPMGTSGSYIVSRRKTGTKSSNPLAFLDGGKLGCEAGSFQYELLQGYLERLGIHVTMAPQTCGAAEIAQKLASGEIDAYLTDTMAKEYLSRDFSLFNLADEDCYFAFSNSRPDLKEQTDSAMQTLQTLHPFLKDELRSKYMTTVVNSVISSEQVAWLDAHDPIRIGYLEGSLARADAETGDVSGVLKEYISFASDCLDNRVLSFEAIAYTSPELLQQAMADGKVDMMFPAVRNLSYGEENGYLLTSRLLTIPMAAVTTKTNFSEADAHTVAVPAHNVTMKAYLLQQYPHWTMVDYPTIDACRNAVSSGKADCLVTTAYEVQSFLKDSPFYCTFLSNPGVVSFMMPRTSNILLSVINQTIAMLPESEMQGALSRFAAPDHKVTLQEFVQQNAASVIAGVVMVFVLFLLVVLNSLIKSKKSAEEMATLNEELTVSQLELEEALAEAEHANQAKSEFLFSMSHDIRTPMNAILGYSELMKKELTDPKLLGYQGKNDQAGNLLLSLINNVLDMSHLDSGKA
ncbi:MAG: transporter substrate-binding domain-containing protein [Clostridia bacterium]|nr:transporter substrate-binding domain-containing protein [Clostridia bacterium]